VENLLIDWRKGIAADVHIDVDMVPPRGGTLQNAVCIVIDVLRATSTIVTLFERGARLVYPVRSLNAARRLARQTGFCTVGEKDAVPVADFDYYNSPAELVHGNYAGQGFVISSTNGTIALVRTANNPLVLCGSLLNASACCEAAFQYAVNAGLPIHLVCSGNFGEFALDDFVCAGRLVQILAAKASRDGKSIHLTEPALAADKIGAGYPDAAAAFRLSSGMRLLQLGRSADIEYCARLDQSSLVPVITNRSPITIERY